MVTDDDVTASILAYRDARIPCDENRCVSAAGMRAAAEEIARRERVRIMAIYERGQADERARIVVLLRQWSAECIEDAGVVLDSSDAESAGAALGHAADTIEAEGGA